MDQFNRSPRAMKLRPGKSGKQLIPPGLFVRPRIIIGSEHSKSVFVTAEIARVDFIQNAFQCWDFPPGYADIVELSEGEFHKHVRLGRPAEMARRDQPTPVGDLLVSFTKLQLRGGNGRSTESGRCLISLNAKCASIVPQMCKIILQKSNAWQAGGE